MDFALNKEGTHKAQRPALTGSLTPFQKLAGLTVKHHSLLP